MQCCFLLVAICFIAGKATMHSKYMQPRVSVEKFPGEKEPTEAKKIENNTIKPFPEEGGATIKKTEK